MTDQPLTVLDEVVIAAGRQPRSRVFAGVHILPNRELLVGYREGTDHLQTDDGATMMTRSTDCGKTWSDPVAVCAIPGWDCAGANRILQLEDGNLLMFVFQARWSRSNDRTEPIRESHVFPTRSSDGGRTWSEFGPEVQLFDGWSEPYAHGNLIVGNDGSWLLPVHGADRVGGTTYSILASSPDMGRNWSRRGVVAQSEGFNFYETDVLRLDDGRLTGVIRSDDPPFDSFIAFSSDDGFSWTEPKPTGFRGPTPRLSRLRSGALLCAYRDRDPQRPGVSYSISEDNGNSWRFSGQLYEATDWNCGYPDMVRLPNDEIFCVFYTAYRHGDSEIHGLWLQDET